MNSKSLNKLVLTAMMTAIVFVCTMFIKMPVGPDCYIHLGDAAMLIGALILPRKHGCFAGAVGAAMADLMGGYAFWAPWTFFIKLACVLVFSFAVGSNIPTVDNKKLGVREIIGYILVSVVCVGGYFIAEYLMFGNWVAAAACILPNMLQIGVACVICGLVVRRIRKLS